MAEIINLRQARKRRARADKERRAANNRVEFGIGKAARRSSKDENARSEKRHDAKQMEPDPKVP